MNTNAPEFIYIAFILPALFASTFICEGLYKIKQHEDGYFLFSMGLIFLATITFAYMYLFK